MKSLPGIFTRVTTNRLALPIKKIEINTYIDDIMIEVDTKTQMIDRFRNLHDTPRKPNLKAAPDKTYFFFAAVQFLGQVITKNRIKPRLNKLEANHQMKLPESKKVVEKLLGTSNYHSK